MKKANAIKNGELIDVGEAILKMYQDDVSVSISEEEEQNEAIIREKYEAIEEKIGGTSVEKLKSKADKNDHEAQVLLGFCYYEGRGVARDYSKAFEMFKSAADGGHETGIAFVKMCYMHGVGVKPSLEKIKEYPWSEDDYFSWRYYNAGYYGECIGRLHEAMEGYLFQLDNITPKNETEKVFYERYYKYKSDLRSVADSYSSYVKTYLSEIKPAHISDDMLISMGYDASLVDMWKETNQIYEHKRLLADILSIHAVTCQFYNDVLEELLDKINDTLLDFEIMKDEKHEVIDRLWFSYDMFRNLSIFFLMMCEEELKTYDIGIYRNILYINKKTSTTQNIALIFETLLDLSFPYDFRACRMFFDLYRFDDTFDKAEWAFIYSYDFIYRMFALSYAWSKYLNEVFEDPITRADDKISIEQVLINTIKAMTESIDLYDSLVKDVDYEDTSSYVFMENPTQEEIWAQGIGTLETVNDKVGKIRNLHFALSNSLPVLDFMVEALMYIFKKEGNGVIGLTTIGEELQELYSDLKTVRQDIIKRVYKNAFVYDGDDDREKLSILEMEKAENNLEQQMDLCDMFDLLTEFMSVKQLDDLFERKKKMLKQLKDLHPKTKERLIDSMEKASQAIRKMLTEGGYNSEYLEKIDAMLENRCVSKESIDLRVFRTALASGEFLYQTYIYDKGENKEFDYSFVAVQYYTALEALLKKSFYEPYVKIIQKEADIKALSRVEISSYFPDDNIIGVSFGKKGKYNLKPASKIELGPIGKVFANSKKPDKLKQFLLDELHISDMEITQYGERIMRILDPRNKAAHGNETVSFEEAKMAKETTFNKDEINQYRGLIYDFISMMEK